MRNVQICECSRKLSWHKGVILGIICNEEGQQELIALLRMCFNHSENIRFLIYYKVKCNYFKRLCY